jgi:hypothetical protein
MRGRADMQGNTVCARMYFVSDAMINDPGLGTIYSPNRFVGQLMLDSHLLVLPHTLAHRLCSIHHIIINYAVPSTPNVIN